MKSLFKRLILVVLCLSILFSLSVQPLAASEDSNVHKLLQRWADGINSKDLNLYLSAFDAKFQDGTLAVFKNSTEEERNVLTFYCADKITVKNIRKLSLEDAESVMDLRLYKNSTYEVYYLYFVAKLKDKKYESKYVSNGENFRLCLITNQNGEWRISELASAPVDILSKYRKVNLQSATEQALQAVSPVDAAMKSAASGTDASVMVAAASGPIYTEPDKIRVMLRYTGKVQLGLQASSNDKTNYQAWGVPVGSVVVPTFQDYIQDVLPNEWPAWTVVPDSTNTSLNLTRALNAGALMVKTFSWYMKRYPWMNEWNADVNDDATQAYRYNTRTAMRYDGKSRGFNWGATCQAAFNNMSTYFICNKSDYTPIKAVYLDTDQYATCDKDKAGYTVPAIINYIYTANHPLGYPFGILVNTYGPPFPTYWN